MFTLVQGITMFTQLCVVIMVNVTIGLVGKLEVRGNKTELEMNLELHRSFHMIYKLRTWFFPRAKKLEFFLCWIFVAYSSDNDYHDWRFLTVNGSLNWGHKEISSRGQLIVPNDPKQRWLFLTVLSYENCLSSVYRVEKRTIS